MINPGDYTWQAAIDHFAIRSRSRYYGQKVVVFTVKSSCGIIKVAVSYMEIMTIAFVILTLEH